jgi:RNA polymerase sigma-70 factor (ECF subfamily)
MTKRFDSEDFLKMIKVRDSAAFESLVTAYTGQIYNACLGLGFNSVEADDLTQNVWLTFFDVVQNFEGRSKVRTFLFGILYNKASEFRKKNNKIDLNIDIEDILDKRFDSKGHWITGPKDPEKFLSSTQTMKLIADCLDLLPLNQKMAFSLREIEEDLTEEICNIMSITPTNLGVLLFRARNQLRECIEKKT